MIESSSQRGSLSKITAQLDHRHPAIDCSNLAQQVEGSIPRTIVDQHNLETFAVNLHDRFEAVIKIRDVLLLIVQRDHNGISRHEKLLYRASGRFCRSISAPKGLVTKLE